MQTNLNVMRVISVRIRDVMDMGSPIYEIYVNARSTLDSKQSFGSSLKQIS